MVFEEFVGRRPRASPLTNPFLTPGGWLEDKMRALKGFSRLEMCFNIQYGMMMESIVFVCNCIQKCSLSI